MEVNKIIITLMISILISLSDGYKILVIFPVPARSHFNLGSSLTRGLVEAGHDVTFICPFSDENPPSGGKYTEVLIDYQILKEKQSVVDMEQLNPFLMFPMLSFLGGKISENVYSHENFKKLINSGQKFDLIIIEQFFNDALKAIAWHYKAPLIVFSTMGANIMVNRLVGTPTFSSYIPDFLTSFDTNMNFYQRMYNSALLLAKEVHNSLFTLPNENALVKKYFPDSPDLQTYVNNVSLVLLNAHESVNFPVPLVPNMINIGGFHLKASKELPKDLKEILDKSTQGAIYFSMGSNVNPAELPVEVRSAIIGALGKLKQTAIVKWYEEVADVPKNVIIRKWYPQQDILAHHNVKVFITHGGLLSTLETIYHGVSVLTLPVFGDQKMNANRAVTAGYGLSIALSDITEKNLLENLNELLNNSKYTENVKRRSVLMKDRPVKPLNLAVYWCEFVIRHKGAQHLRVAAMDLTWYQYYLLDIICFFFVSCIFVYYLLSYVIKKFCCSMKNKIRIEKLKVN